MKEIEYDRARAYEYAKQWAYKRNPKYYNFDSVGGDCTSFASQCIYEGIKVMNYTKDVGWYYIDGNRKSPSWSGVQYLYNFLTKNKSVGPYAEETTKENLQIGDIAQLSFDGISFAHTLVIVKIENHNNLNQIYSASHTIDTFERPISSYNIKRIRFLHIIGGRKIR